eukprot:scaffold26384_cov36-Tisochrysis_lutea.AAC.3
MAFAFRLVRPSLRGGRHPSSLRWAHQSNHHYAESPRPGHMHRFRSSGLAPPLSTSATWESAPTSSRSILPWGTPRLQRRSPTCWLGFELAFPMSKRHDRQRHECMVAWTRRDIEGCRVIFGRQTVISPFRYDGIGVLGWCGG